MVALHFDPACGGVGSGFHPFSPLEAEVNSDNDNDEDDDTECDS